MSALIKPLNALVTAVILTLLMQHSAQAGDGKPVRRRRPRPISGGDPVYTATNSTSDLWFSGTHWSSKPVSGAGTELTFNGGSPYTNITNVNTNNIFTPNNGFELSTLDLSGSGAAAGNGSSITIAAANNSFDYLNFVLNGATVPQINLTGDNGNGMIYNVSAPIHFFVIELIVTGNGTATFNFSGQLQGITLVKNGTSALTLSGTGNSINLIELQGGQLNINSSTATGTGTLFVGAGTILDNTSGAGITCTGNNFQEWGGSFTFAGSNDLNLGTGEVSLDQSINITVNGSTLTVGGGITDSGHGYAITKDGPGTLVFTDATSYGGGTGVYAGTLLVNNTSGSGTGSGPVVVNNSGTILGGTGTISGAVTINQGAAIQGGAGATGQTLTLQGSLTMESGSIINLALGPGLTHSTLARSSLAAWTFALGQEFTFTNLGATPGVYLNLITGLSSDPGNESGWTISNPGFTGTFVYDGVGDIDLELFTAVPEPGTWAAASLALLAVAVRTRKRLSRRCHLNSRFI